MVLLPCLPASLLVDYFWQKDFNLEVELGERWSWHNQGTTKVTCTEFIVAAGFRNDFNADSRQKCASLSILAADCKKSAQNRAM